MRAIRKNGKESLARVLEAEAAIERFLKSSRRPALLEPGEERIVIGADNFYAERQDGRLTVQAWDGTRHVVRRVVGIREERLGKLELIVERFGKRQGTVLLCDLERPAGAWVGRRERRMVLREWFRRFLLREFPGWKLAELSAEPNLECSLSPSYPRALLRKGQQAIAALACPQDPGAANGALSFALIWLDHVRRRERQLCVEDLLLLLPAGLEKATALRLRWLDPGAVRVRLYVFGNDGLEWEVDPLDWGNLETRLDPCRRPDAADAGWLERLQSLKGVECVAVHDGSVSLRVNGLEFARLAAGRLRFGWLRHMAATQPDAAEIEQLAAELARVRCAESPDPTHPLWRLVPERWLESQVRKHIERLDARLLPDPVYGQVPAMAGAERGVIDLLAAERSGRLVVLELKTCEDVQLPLQALDYWMRVKWHLDRDEFTAAGYFPGLTLSRQTPRLVLVAPALQFHPTTETILRFFSTEVPVERIGVGVEWRRDLRVMFHLCGTREAA
ncbi:MAG: hypothetical protein RMK57_08180 [Bryobacterales bacterium]|nr:hypothetical protein [Bryobacteraceae bacterium]MDW8354493.1 hypothetical protein [Bryobacterales bacterium]